MLGIDYIYLTMEEVLRKTLFQVSPFWQPNITEKIDTNITTKKGKLNVHFVSLIIFKVFL